MLCSGVKILCRNINSGYALVSRETSLFNLGLLTIQCWGFSVSLTAAIVRFRSLLVSFSVGNTWGKRQDTPCAIPRLFLDPENTVLLLLAIAFFRGSLIDALDAGDHSRRVTPGLPQLLFNLSWIYTASLPHENLQHTEGNKLFSCLYSFADQIWYHHLFWSNSCHLWCNIRSMWGRWGVDVRSM